MAEYFEFENLKVNFRTFEGVKNVLNIKNLSIKKGESFGLVGESGAGKTTLAYTILKLLPIPPAFVESGAIRFEGEDLLKKSDGEIQKIRGKKISIIFQDPMSTLNPVFTTGQQIIRVLQHNQGLHKAQAKKKAVELMNIVKLPDPENILSKYPHELSGGQRQRIIIALAFSCSAQFLIADEPTRNLDVTIQAGVLQLIAELIRETKVTVLFIGNSLELVSLICDRVGVLHRGQIVELGSIREVATHPAHSYTLTLLRAIPKEKRDKIDLTQITLKAEERVAEKGCRYVGRCLRKEKICLEEEPELKHIGGTHYVACHLYKEEKK
jgi:oligopeptide/dipeptide ABC transporter ATP-binding protein